MSRDHILHFTIGPVQGFIEQARRTRDFWAGSFLLAWLSSIAMHEASDAVDIAFPKIEKDQMMLALRSAARPAEGPRIGTVPNRFKAKVAGDFDPQIIEDAVLRAWKALADAVRTNYVDPVASRGNDTRAIWDRQIDNFWEIAWVMGPADGLDGDWLDRRKNWRSYRPPTEAGDHCTLMGDWQEISGWTGHNDRLDRETRQTDFWNDLRAQPGIGDLNLAVRERLCAIALVRRLFPLLTDQDRRADAVPLWKTPDRWPSTGHMAAVRWIAMAAKEAPAACQGYFDFVRTDPNLGARWSLAEQHTTVQCLAQAQPFAAIDANLFFSDNIANPRTYQLDDPDVIKRLQMRLQDQHQKLGKALEPHGIAKEPRPYYALLRMDGDNVGRLLRGDGEKVVGAALAEFGGDVAQIVTDHDGVLIYAGGDDVLALLPIDTAICAALRLERAYRGHFPENWPDAARTPTISASIVFADHHEPLRAVLRQSRRLLEEVAKHDNGKDSLAIAVLKPSGPAVEWVARWHDDAGASIPDAIRRMEERVGTESDISARFSYTLDRRFLATLGDRFPELGLRPPEIEAVLRATLGKRREDNRPAAEEIEHLVKELLLIGLPHHGPSYRGQPQPGLDFSVGGLRLAFFLAGRDGAEQRDAAA